MQQSIEMIREHWLGQRRVEPSTGIGGRRGNEREGAQYVYEQEEGGEGEMEKDLTVSKNP